VLFISLMLLLMLTILGVTAMNNVTLEERMAGNLRDTDLAFQAGEAALRDGENWLAPLPLRPAECTTSPPSACATVWQQGMLNGLQNQDYAWWNTSGRDYLTAATNEFGSVVQDPKFIIEYNTYVRDSLVVGQGAVTGRDYYLVTARAEGGSDKTVSVLQSSVVKRFN
jgi:type IV pilus assembly protein PilX